MQDRELMHLLIKISNTARYKPWKAENASQKPSEMGHILELLRREDGLSQQEIADKLGIRPQSVSEAVARLEGRGLLCKIPDEHDRRATKIFITERGIARRQELARLRQAHAQSFFEVLTEEEKVCLAGLLQKLEAATAEKNKEETL